jgi:coproporphyrinogen III oxidase
MPTRLWRKQYVSVLLRQCGISHKPSLQTIINTKLPWENVNVEVNLTGVQKGRIKEQNLVWDRTNKIVPKSPLTILVIISLTSYTRQGRNF